MLCLKVVLYLHIVTKVTALLTTKFIDIMETIQFTEISQEAETAIREFNNSFHAILQTDCPATKQVEEECLQLQAETIKECFSLESFSSIGRGEIYGIQDGQNVRIKFPIVVD